MPAHREVGLEKRILIVGGSPDQQEQLRLALAGRGRRVYIAADNAGGLFQFGLVRPHLVILDIDEWETLERLRSLSSVPIIALTAGEVQRGAESLHHGADFFVNKPPSLGELGAKVRASLRRV